MRALLGVTMVWLSLLSAFGDTWQSPRPVRPDVTSIDANHGQVWAFYGQMRAVEQITSDTTKKLKMLDTLLSPSRDRYFYVEVTPDFVPQLSYGMRPNFDSGARDDSGIGKVDWDRTRIAMRLHVHRLSGEKVTTIEFPQSYFGGYARGQWLGDRWIALHDRSGHQAGNWFTLFVNVETGEKRLVGLVIGNERATTEGRFVMFPYGGLFFVNFRPVYPIYDEQLPDFGDEKGWNGYKQKYFDRGETRPWNRVRGHSISDYEITPDGKQAIVLDHWPHFTPEERKELGLPPEATTSTAIKRRPPELVFIDLEKIEAAKDPKQYTRIVVLPDDLRAGLQRDDKKGEIQVWAGDGRTILWRRSFADLATAAP